MRTKNPTRRPAVPDKHSQYFLLAYLATMSAPWSQNLASWATASPTRTDTPAHRSLSSLSRTAEQKQTDVRTVQASYVTEEASNTCRSVGSDSATQSPQHSNTERPSPPPLLHYMPATDAQQSFSSDYRVRSARINHSPSPAKEPNDLQAKWHSLSATFKGASTRSLNLTPCYFKIRSSPCSS